MGQADCKALGDQEPVTELVVVVTPLRRRGAAGLFVRSTRRQSAAATAALNAMWCLRFDYVLALGPCKQHGARTALGIPCRSFLSAGQIVARIPPSLVAPLTTK